MPIITLLTDFGTADGYVGEIKGMLLSQVADALLIDISHQIAPQDVESARFILERYWRRFPVGTVHLVVVDPGVGSSRAALAVHSDHRFLVGPDNGVLSAALTVPGAYTVALPTPPGASATFHGRDVFAPAAAALAMGTPLDQIGVPRPHPLVLERTAPVDLPDGGLAGEVVHIDRFGNAITNLPGPDGPARVEAAGLDLPLVRTYAEVDSGAPLALLESNGYVEIAVREGNAAEQLGLTRGARVVLRVAGQR